MTLESFETGASLCKFVGYTPTKRLKTTSGRTVPMVVARSHRVTAISADKWSNKNFLFFTV